MVTPRSPRAVASGRMNPRDDRQIGALFPKPRPGGKGNTSDLYATCIRCGVDRQVAGNRPVSDLCTDCKATLLWEATDVAMPDYDADNGPPRKTIEYRERDRQRMAERRKKGTQ